MEQKKFSKKYFKRRRTYPSKSETSPDKHDKAALIIGTSKTNHGSLEFAETEVDVDLAPQFEEFVLNECEDSTGLVLIAIEGHALWIENMLRDTFATMPALIHNQALAKSGGGSSTVPLVAEKELTFAVDHVYTCETSEAENRYLNLSSSQIARFARMFGWISPEGAIPKYADRPVVVMVVEAGHSLLDKIEAMYLTEHRRRWQRLCTEPCWMFADTFYLATSWHRVMEALTENLTTIEILVYNKALPVITLARVLHMDIATTIELREYLRAHRETVERVHSRTKERYTMEMPKKPDSHDSILHRLAETCEVLEHHEKVVATIREQLDNLLSLLFNIETVEQGKTVTRLSALAFVFIPLSFVAFHASPRWYAAAGPTVLIVTLIGAFGFVKLLNFWEQYSTKPTRFRGWSRGVPSVSAKDQEIEVQIKGFSKRTPTLESMNPKSENRIPLTHVPTEKKADASVDVNVQPSNFEAPKSLDSESTRTKDEVASSVQPSQLDNQSSLASQPIKDNTVPGMRVTANYKRPARAGRADRFNDHYLDRETLPPSNRPTSSSATLGFRRTVGTASEIERRLRVIREEGITARDDPSRLVLQSYRHGSDKIVTPRR